MTMKRWDIINKLVKKYDYDSYLELGYGNGDTFEKIINVEYKLGVDVGKIYGNIYVDLRKINVNSFSIFSKLDGKKFDIIFIDASHKSEDVERDLSNSLNFLKDNGTIVMHDCNPEVEEWQMVPPSPKCGFWTGDVWKTFLKFRSTRKDLQMEVVDTDFGCGIVRFGNQDLFPLKQDQNIDYKFFNENRKEILNLITVEDFMEKYK